MLARRRRRFADVGCEVEQSRKVRDEGVLVDGSDGDEVILVRTIQLVFIH